MAKKGGMMPKTKKSGKKMNFSQAVIGHTAMKSRKATPGSIAAPSAGKVGAPKRNKGGTIRGGKRIY